TAVTQNAGGSRVTQELVTLILQGSEVVSLSKPYSPE
ncbi:hypothetical protein LEMLEM_LOCUS12818, partial [Lemmus lemmus]